MTEINVKGTKIIPEEIPEKGCRFYWIEEKKYAVCKENGHLRFFELKPLEIVQ